MPPALDGLVEVHVHELEDQGQAARGLVVEDLVELDDVRVPGQAAQRLDLPEVVDLVGGDERGTIGGGGGSPACAVRAPRCAPGTPPGVCAAPLGARTRASGDVAPTAPFAAPARDLEGPARFATSPPAQTETDLLGPPSRKLRGRKGLANALHLRRSTTKAGPSMEHEQGVSAHPRGEEGCNAGMSGGQPRRREPGRCCRSGSSCT